MDGLEKETDDVEKISSEKKTNNKKKEKMNIKSRLLFIGIVVIFTTLVVGLGYITYKEFTKTDNNDEQITWEEKDLPRIDASLATQPLVDAFLKEFTGKDIKIEYTNTHPAYEKLANGEIDLIVVTSPSEEAKKILEENNVEIEIIPVVNEAFVFFVNQKNPVDNLSLKQIQDIYSGNTTKWSEVGGEDKEILAYQRPETSGSQTGMHDLVMKDIKMKKPITKEYLQGMADAINYVAEYEDNDRAIAYSYYYYANVMYANDQIKFLGVDGIKPTFKTIQDGSYPIKTAYYLVFNKNEAKDSKVRKMVNDMLSLHGQKVAQEAGYVPAK